MRSDITELPRTAASGHGSGWMQVDATGAMRGWPGVLGGGPVGVFPPPVPPSAPPAPVVSLAERRESDAQRHPPRRVPDEDIVTLDRTPGAAPAGPASQEEILDLAHVAGVTVSGPSERSAPIPFRRPVEPPSERMRRIVYVAAAGIIMATGAIYTYKSSNAPRVISVPDAISPTNRVT